MREIKFRVWDKEQKVMYEVKKVDFSEQKVFCKQYYLNDWKFSEIELMQYTNLKDKNDKEIYEGDVVADQYGYMFKIVFRDGCWFAANSEVGFAPKDEFTVIGNIYENPELLESIINESI